MVLKPGELNRPDLPQEPGLLHSPGQPSIYAWELVPIGVPMDEAAHMVSSSTSLIYTLLYLLIIVRGACRQ